MSVDLTNLPETDDDLESSSLSPDEREAQRKQRSDARAARKHERQLAQIALDHVKPEHVESALTAYERHVSAGYLPPDDVGAHDAHAHSFFGTYAGTNPHHARPAPPKPASAAIKQQGPYKW
jgi:hypothetical protein